MDILLIHNATENQDVNIFNWNKSDFAATLLIGLIEWQDAAIQLKKLSAGVNIYE